MEDNYSFRKDNVLQIRIDSRTKELYTEVLRYMRISPTEKINFAIIDFLDDNSDQKFLPEETREAIKDHCAAFRANAKFRVGY